MIKIVRNILLSLGAFVCTSLYSQEFSATVSKNTVSVGEQFKLIFSINNSASNFTPPNLDDFVVYSGPNQSSSMQFINGNISQSFSISYILSARKEGKLTIGAATINSGKKTLKSNTLTVEVVKGNSPPSQQQANNDKLTAPKGNDKNLFVKTSVNKFKAYVGEQIILTQKVYTRLNLRGFQDIIFPNYNSFWIEDVPAQSQISMSTEYVDGVPYNVAEIKRSIIFPQKNGILTIDPIEIECIVREKSSKGGRSFFDDFFGSYDDVMYKIKSSPVKIEAIPLPENNKPASFSGAVGDFSCNIKLDKTSIKANEAVTLSVSVTGKGNIKMLENLNIEAPEDFETYDPKISDNISVSSNGVSGSKNIEYLYIPRYAGDYTINPKEFSFFDPAKKTYVTIPSPEFTLHVAESEKQNTDNTSTIISKESIKWVGADIRHIKTGDVLFTYKGKFLIGSVAFYMIITLLLALFIAFIIIYRRLQKAKENVISYKSSRAAKMAKKHLYVASKQIKENNIEMFWIEISKAIYGYLGDRLNIPTASLSKEKIIEILIGRKVSTSVINQLTQTLNEYEYMKFAPASSKANIGHIYTQAEELIKNIEKEL